MKPAFNSTCARVALLIESSREYGRELMAGVAKFMRQHGAWSVSLQEHSLCDDVSTWLASWKGDGILTRVENPAVTELIKRLDLPAVSLRTERELKIPCVLTNNPLCSKMAFDHLRERGFRNFAFCGFAGADYSDERRDSFVACTAEAGMKCHVFGEHPSSAQFSTETYEKAGLADGDLVANWLRALPKPIGLMACNDMRGLQVLNACRSGGVVVPDEIAVIGVDNERILCDLSDPTLSSVVPNAERIGYEAAELLDQMMNGQKVEPTQRLIEPRDIVVRRSTEVLAIEDPQVAAAARFIREHACRGIDVSDVLRVVPMSRSTLDRKFWRFIGHSPKDEILRVRLNRVKELLAETDFSQSLIAEKAGFEYIEYLSRIFKKRIGLTPSEFRARAHAVTKD